MEVMTTSAPLAEICKKYNVQPSSVYKWKEDFIHGGTRALSGINTSYREKHLEEQIKQLKEMVADLALANELLKKGQVRR
jgi:transposase-like protein